MTTSKDNINTTTTSLKIPSCQLASRRPSPSHCTNCQKGSSPMPQTTPTHPWDSPSSWLSSSTTSLEGFAMALPLYLALGSRLRAMLWASLLGGISQPFGAGIAALWFKIAGSEGHKPGTAVYGCMFAITAGIMASVALQLFVESLTLNHSRNLCIAFAFIGMAIMGTRWCAYFLGELGCRYSLVRASRRIGTS